MSSSNGFRASRVIFAGTLVLGMLVAVQASAAFAVKPPVIPPVPLPVTKGTCYLSINDRTVGEASGQAVLTVSRTPCALASSVQYSTLNGTALAGSDFTASSGTLTFARAETSKTLSIGLINDGIAEGPETFSVQLSNPTRALISDASGVVAITDDDQVNICEPFPQCLL